MNMVSYVHYDCATGELLGGYLQVPLEEHECRVPASDEQRRTWPMWMLNEDWTALVMNPIYLPEEPPVDPDPEQPVQSDN